MSCRGVGIAWVMGLGLAQGCERAIPADQTARDSLMLLDRQTRVTDAVAHLDTIPADRPIAQWNLPQRLREISGLALSPDGRLFTHGDEVGKVFEVDYRRGVVLGEFSLGAPVVHGDFEAIAWVHDSLLLLTSTGLLYHFPPGTDGEVVPYTMRDTGLGDACEFESLAFDSTAATLLLACKKVYLKPLKDSLVIFKLPVEPPKSSKPESVTRLTVPMARITASTAWARFEPSDLTINPFNGNLVLVDSREKGLLEMTPKGSVVSVRALPPGHDQPEGIAITRDHLLIISDEAKGGPALITLYRWPL